MELRKLTAKDVKKIENKKIYCYEYSASYLQELCEKYSIINHIRMIFDDSVRNQGTHMVMDKEVMVCGSEILTQEDMSEAAFVITSDYHYEVYEKLKLISTINQYFDTIYYFANKETEYEEQYRLRYRYTPLQNVIIFRSGPHASAYVKGMDFSDNARALFEYMLSNHYNNTYRLVWLVKNPTEFKEYKDIPNVEFISFDWSVSDSEKERDLYYNTLCLAKVIFFTDAYGFARNCRSDQTRVQLWHGCGFKTRVNFVRCEKRYEYMTVISNVYSKIHQDIYGLRKDQLLVTGYAKHDWLFQPLEDFSNQLQIPVALKYIFWLPTFRIAKAGLDNLNEYELQNQTGLPIVDSLEKIEELNSLLKEKNMVLLVKLHPFQDKMKICKVNMSHIILLDNEWLVDKDVQINQILGNSDALISDYSSAAVDYMLLNKPIAFTLDDVNEYKKSRGLVFPDIHAWLPGEELYTYDDFRKFIIDISAGKDKKQIKRRNLFEKMFKFSDANNCRRILKALKITME